MEWHFRYYSRISFIADAVLLPVSDIGCGIKNKNKVFSEKEYWLEYWLVLRIGNQLQPPTNNRQPSETTWKPWKTIQTT